MSGEQGQQRVVIIQDALREVTPSMIRWVLRDSSLKAGDVLMLFGVLHQFVNPMGYKVKVDSNSMFGVNPKLIADEVAKKKEEYSSNEEIMKITEECQIEQIEFRVEVKAGPVAKDVAIRAAKSLRATWVILDRQLKKEKKFFMDKLPCGISGMKRDNSIQPIRGPRARAVPKKPDSKGQDHLRYDEMIPAWPKDGIVTNEARALPKTNPENGKLDEHAEGVSLHDHEKPSSSHKSSSSAPLMTSSASTSSSGYYEVASPTFPEARSFFLNFGEQQNGASAEKDIAGEPSENSIAESQDREEASTTGSPNEQPKEHKNDDDWMGGGSLDEVFRNYMCSHCKNRRPKIGWKRDFTYGELHAATKGFSANNFLSEGGFGSVYKGELNGLKIAVKQQKSASLQGEKEFKAEVNVLSKARHENLVMLLGSCSEGSNRLLVYEYVCHGSLDQHLSKHTRKPLSWERRMKIARGAATGLLYLHQNKIIHRDMRPNNILVTHDYEALLGDFGLARTQREDAEFSSETRVVGTLGYLAPEYAECGKVSRKTDVYSFGVVLLQLITGLKTTDKILGGKSLVGWARPLLKEKNYPNLIDKRILDSHDVHQLFWMVRVAEKCLSKDPEKRLTMDTVVYALNQIMEKSAKYGIEVFSPVQSDTPSTRDSFETLDEDDDDPDDDTTSCFTVETTSVSSLSQASARLPTTPPQRLPVSPPIRALLSKRSGASTSHGGSDTSGGGTNGESKKGTSQGGGVLYDEMVD